MSSLPASGVPAGAIVSLDGRIFTPWFEHAQKPSHRGVYETRVASLLYAGGYWYGFSYWTGERWKAGSHTVKLARTIQRVGAQNKQWRGLARASRSDK